MGKINWNLKNKSLRRLKIFRVMKKLTFLGYNFMLGVDGQNLGHIELPDPKDGKCQICGKQFTHIPNARRHMRERHGGLDQKSKLECQICGATFGRKGNLLRHITKSHNVSQIE